MEQSYGIDEYGRYVEKDGERLVIEPWPYKRPISARIVARWHVLLWYLHGGWRR